jgi:asparagine synthase (glutamine-hydrolysing)
MPGLAGVIQSSTGPAELCFQRLFAQVQDESRLQEEARFASDGRWVLRRVSLRQLHGARQLNDKDTVHVVFHGELDNEADLKNLLEEEVGQRPSKGMAPLIAALYRLYGKDFASRMQGAFCLALLDENTKRIILASDHLGSYPIYLHKGADRFVFATDLKTVLRDPGVEPVLDPRAVADYLSFGFILGDRTLARHVKLLPAASVLTFCWDDWSCKVERYWRLEDTFLTWKGSKAAYLEALNHTFNIAVGRALSRDRSVAISLSGGLDSRAILSAIQGAQSPVSTFTLGVKGCADEVIAEKLSRIAGTEHCFIELGEGYVGEFLIKLRNMVSLTDGMYLSHGLTEMLALQFLEQADVRVLLRGHGGELAKSSLAWPLHTDDRIYRMRTTNEFLPYIIQRINYVSRGVALQELFTDDWWAQMNGGPRRSLEECVADVPLSPPDLCSYLYLTQHHRRCTIASLELFRNCVEVRMPFVDGRFLQVLFQGAPRWRDGTDIHRSIIGTNSPDLLKVRNSNTGASGDASPFAERVWDKVNSLCKRLNLYGYRHYHSFEQWMKHKLVESVEQVLLNSASLGRGILRESSLRQLIGETKQGVRDHGYLLQILLILELWQQENERRGFGLG